MRRQVVEDIGDEQIGVEEGGLIGIDAGDVGVGEFGGRAEVTNVAIDDSFPTELHRRFKNVNNRKQPSQPLQNHLVGLLQTTAYLLRHSLHEQPEVVLVASARILPVRVDVLLQHSLHSLALDST